MDKQLPDIKKNDQLSNVNINIDIDMHNCKLVTVENKTFGMNLNISQGISVQYASSKQKMYNGNELIWITIGVNYYVKWFTNIKYKS